MAKLEAKTKLYPSDLTDEEWEAFEPLLPRPARAGRKRTTDLREVLNAIRYMVRSGREWRMLPVHFRPWQTVYWWFRRFVRLLLFRTIHDVALMADRERIGREASPSAGIVDSQTVKAPAAVGSRGYDAAKRNIAVDTDGRLLMVNLTTADISDSAGAQAILDKTAFLDFVVEVVRRTDAEAGFNVIPRRWVVERSFGWLTRYRRLVCDYEVRLDVSGAMIYAAMASLLVRRISH